MTGWEIITGDSLDVMAAMPEGSVDAIVTSPFYADQRAYKPGELGGRRGNCASTSRIRAQSRAARSGAPARWVDADGARPTTVLTYAVGGEPNPDAHPARMPIGLARQLVAMCCPPGGLVLDPFSGNATTGIAATRSGRRYVGIEIDADYAEASRRRLAEDAPLLQGLEEAVAPEPLW